VIIFHIMGVTVPNGNPSVNGSSSVSKHDLPSHFIGGNALESAPPSTVKDFVASHDGHSVITSVRNSRNAIESGEKNWQLRLTFSSIGAYCQQRYRRC
jgi:hypothetical protein